MPDPGEIAKRQAERARIQAFNRQRLRWQEENLRANGRVGSGAEYLGYDADAETHLVDTAQGVRPVRDLLTNAGLNSGDKIEWIGSTLDAMPRHKPEPEDDPQLGEDEPVWGVLIRRRAKTGTTTKYYPPREPQYSDPVPASWNMLYIAKNELVFNASAFAKWDASNQRRYGFGYTLLGCGGTSSDSLYRRDQDPYCRESYTDWKFVLDLNLRGIATGGAPACHLRQAIPYTVDGSIWTGVNFVIGALVFSPDGVSQVPTLPTGAFPQFWNKVRNPEYPLGGFVSAPPGQRYLDCDDIKGAEIDMLWELLEIIPVSDYVPTRLIREGYPGGVGTFPKYENQYWLFTATGTTLVFSVPDYNAPDSPTSSAKPQQVWLSVNEQGIFQVDAKIGEPAFSEDEISFTFHKYHFEVQGGVSAQVTTSKSWRRQFTNSLTENPLPGDSHPCVSRYQAERGTNILENLQRITQVEYFDNSQIQQGGAVELRVWSYPSDAVCTLPGEATTTLTLTLPPFDTRSIELESGDFWNIVEVAANA
jgi:hypothetical protein